MTPDQIEAERTKFEERWAKEFGFGNKPTFVHNWGYVLSSVNGMWQGWLARAEEQYASWAAAVELTERQEPQRLAMEAKHERGK